MPGHFQNWNRSLRPSAGPMLIGHRGHRLRRLGHRTAEVENTMAAFHRAWAAGCDGLELDLRLSRDGRLVVHHDAWLRTPTGRWEIAHTPWRQLRRQTPGLTTLPTVLRRFGARCWLDLEIKAPGAERAVLAALRHQPPRRGFVLSSFDPAILRRLRRLDPGVPLCWNLAAEGPIRWPRLRLACVAAHERRITAAFLRACRRHVAANWRLPERQPASLVARRSPAAASNASAQNRAAEPLLVLAWTVNRPARMRQLAALGVAAILSDHPALLVRTLGQPGVRR